MNMLPLSVAAAGLLLFSSPVMAEETVVPRFTITSIQLEGNTILPSSHVASLLKMYVGPNRDFGTIQEAIESIESAYKERGYTLVTVQLPEQELQDGVVRLQVIEPRLKGITIEGNRHFSKENILTNLPSLAPNQPPNSNSISENIRAVNENPAKKLAVQFKSGETPTDLNATVKVDDQKPWKVSLTADNTGTAESGRYRTGVQFQHANLWNRDHVAALQYSTSPDHLDEVKIFSGSYRIPFYSIGDTLDLFAGYSDVDNGLVQKSFSMSGKGTVAGVRYNLGMPRFGGYEHKLAMGIDYREYDNTLFQGNTNLNSASPDYTVHPLSVTYSGSWKTDQLTFDGYLGFAQNIPWGGHGSKDYFDSAFDMSRPDPAADYTIMRYGFNKLVRLPHDFMVRAAGNGQHSFDRLVPGEQFGLGGAASVRGYEEREESYDSGFSGNLELYSPDLASLAGNSKFQLRLLGFFDGGTGYNSKAQTVEDRSGSLMSAGAGFRLGMGEQFGLGLDWGYALDSSASTRKGDNALHFKAQISF